MVCQQCGKVNDRDAVFCVQCSHPLLQSCPACSTQNTADARFCKHCGTVLDVAFTAAQADRLQTLQKTAPKSLQDKLQKAKTEIEGQRKPVTILFADIVGSTSIAEKLDPEEWKEIVQGAHHRVSEAIHRYEGTIAQLLGDGVMAFFGAPLTHEDDPERAVRAGLEIQASIEEYGGKLAGFVDDFHMRVGIHTGEVVIGPVGSDEHTEYLALGDAVNIAARLEAAAQPGMVLVSEACAYRIQHVFEFDEFRPTKAKGKIEPVQAASVLGVLAKPGLARGLGGVRSPFVGREAELGQLEAALQALCQGQGQIVILLGEAGIGKTRLLEEARLRSCSGQEESSDAHFDPRTIHWLEGRALSYGSSLSFWTINQLLLNDLGLSDGAPQVKIKAALRKRIMELFGEEETPRILPYLAHLLDLAQEGPEGELLKHMDGEAIKYQTLIYLKDYFEHVAKDAPTVLVLEDLNWADPSSLETLEQLLPLTNRVPLMFVLLMRVEREHGSWDLKTAVEKNLPHRTTLIALDRLANEESQALVDQLLGAEGLPDELRGLIFSRSEGNPFYLEEVVRHLLESGWLKEVDGKYIAMEGNGEIGIPETLQGVLLARIDRLDQDVRATLQMASVIGKSFLYKLLQAIAEAELELEVHLSQLQQVDLVREKTRLPELEYMFKHALTREAAYNSLLVERRKTFHRKVAEAMERLFPNRQEEYLGLLAHHFRASGDLDKAADYLIRAGDKARLEDAHDEAVELYEDVLPLLKERHDTERAYQTLLKIGLSHTVNFRYESADRAYELASQIERSDRPHARAMVPATEEAKHSTNTFQFPVFAEYLVSLDLGKVDLLSGIHSTIFIGLARVGTEFNIEPRAAEYWSISESGTRYIFHLRDDIRWSNGEPLTAYDFEWTWLRMLTPESQSPYAYFLDDIVGAREYRMGECEDPKSVGIRALDPSTLEVLLSSPSSYFLYIIASPPTCALPREIIDAYGDEWWHPEHIVCTGPFLPNKFEECEKIFVRNKAFSLPFPGNIDQIIVRTTKSHSLEEIYQQSLSWYKAGIIDTMAINPESIPSWIPAGEIHESSHELTQYFELNPTLVPLDNLLLRNALMKSIDRTEVDLPFKPSTPALGGIIDPSIPGHSPDIGQTININEARIDLINAGYPNGKDLPELTISSLGGYFEELAIELRKQWKKNLGINTHLINWKDAVDPASVHIDVGCWIPDFPDPDTYLRRSHLQSFLEQTGYSNPRLSQLYYEALHSNERRNRLSLYREIDRLLVRDESIIYPLFYGSTEPYCLKSNIKNYHPNFGNYEDVFIEDRE